MSSAPHATVILPVYNCERYIEDAVRSVLGQTFSDFELLLLNDGSTDRTIEIIAPLIEKDSRCRLHSWANRGQVPTRNDGIDMALGDIIFCMDADDICMPQRFQTQVDYLDSHPECVAVGSKVLLIDPDGDPICEFGGDLTHDEIDGAHLSGIGGSRICHPTLAVRRVAIVRVGKYRKEYRFAQDIDLFLRLAEIGRLCNLSDVLLKYRQHEKSVGYLKGDEQRRLARASVEMARIRRAMPPLPATINHSIEAESKADSHRKWAWWALMAGNVATARKHALKALKADPFSKESLKLAACSIRGY